MKKVRLTVIVPRGSVSDATADELAAAYARFLATLRDAGLTVAQDSFQSDDAGQDEAPAA